MPADYTPVDAATFSDDPDLRGWRVIGTTAQAWFAAGSFPAAASLLSAIADLAEAADHHPDLDLRYPDRVRVTLSSHTTGGLTREDVALAATISATAEHHRATPLTALTQSVEIAIDTTDADRIRPFWMAALGYRQRDDELIDPLGIGPTLWFQHTDEPASRRNRIHLDILVPDDQAESRIRSVIDAGGRLADDSFAPAWSVLADADGNEACICTWRPHEPAQA